MGADVLRGHIAICGLARDCADVVGANLAHLLALQSECEDFRISILVAENDSRDGTRTAIRSVLAKHEHLGDVHLELLDGVDEQYPIRVIRIGHLRDVLLRKAIADSQDDHAGPSLPSYYLPIDLDGDFARSLTCANLRSAVDHLDDADADAVFPWSTPVYYDIYALRCPGWVEYDSGDVVNQAQGLPITRLYAKWRFIARAQRRFNRHGRRGPIDVESAFGGFGIYRMESAARASYGAGATVQCEHVTFNRQITRKQILPTLIVSAPLEHIVLRTAGPWARFSMTVRALRKTAPILVRRARALPRRVVGRIIRTVSPRSCRRG